MAGPDFKASSTQILVLHSQCAYYLLYIYSIIYLLYDVHNRLIPFKDVLTILVSIFLLLRYERKGRLSEGLTWRVKRERERLWSKQNQSLQTQSSIRVADIYEEGRRCVQKPYITLIFLWLGVNSKRLPS